MQNLNLGITSCLCSQTKPICCETPGGYYGCLEGTIKIVSDTYYGHWGGRTMHLFCISNEHRRGHQFCPHTWISGFPSYKNWMLICGFQSNYWDLRVQLSRYCYLTRQASVTWSLWCLILTHGPLCSLPKCHAEILWLTTSESSHLLHCVCVCACAYKHMCKLRHVHKECTLTFFLKFLLKYWYELLLATFTFKVGKNK